MKKTLISTLLIAFIQTTAIAADGKWTEGYGQGNLEYFIDFSGKRLHIGCPTKEGSEDSMSEVNVFNLANNKPEKQFSITVGGGTFEGPFDADSRVGESNFHALLKALRKGSAVIHIGKQSFKIPVSNAAKVLPLPGSKDFSCNTMFSR